MSTQNRPLVVGLVSPGLIWLAASVAYSQETPRPQRQPSSSAPASSATYSVLLMSNGTVVRGEITDDPAGGVYRLKTRGGQVPYPKANVKRAGHSIDDLYRYQVVALPPGDFDERMKLVKWCLTQNLTAQAREQLAEVVRLSPDDAEAARMAANLDANADSGKVDPAIQQTSGEMSQDDAPGTLPPELVKRGRKKFGNSLPEIFDLPPAQAVRHASEFAEYVQPILQQNCASCHNDKYQGEFQLVPVRNQKDLRNPDIARSNLDAVLRLVDPNNLQRSEILAAGLVPHGPTKGKGAIFKGSNDPRYAVISKWVRSLQSNKTEPAGDRGEGVSQTRYAPTDPADGFGSDKTRRGAAAGSTGADDSMPIRTGGAHKLTTEINESADFSGGKAADFPLPFALGADGPVKTLTPARSKPVAGRPASNPTVPARSKTVRSPVTKPKTDEPEPQDEGPAVAPTTAKLVAPNTVAVDADTHPNDLPGMNQPMYPSSPSKTPADPDASAEIPPLPGTTGPVAAPAKKKPKIDPALLDKMIKTRSGSPGS